MMKNSLPNHIADALFVHIKNIFLLINKMLVVQYVYVCRCIRPIQSPNSERVLHYAVRSKIQF